MDFGSAVGRAMGFSERAIAELSAYRTSDAFTDEERLVLELADAMTATPADVPGELFRRLRERFTDKQLVELTATIATENWVSRFNRVFDVGSQGFTDGGVCVLPDPGANGRTDRGRD